MKLSVNLRDTRLVLVDCFCSLIDSVEASVVQTETKVQVGNQMLAKAVNLQVCLRLISKEKETLLSVFRRQLVVRRSSAD